MSWHFEHVDGPYGNVTEGPAWDGEALLFTSIQQSRIMRYDPATGASTVYREDTNFANGLMFDPTVCCTRVREERGESCVTRRTAPRHRLQKGSRASD